MKQLTCEMCGGTDLIKDGGVFICQTCGCKYSVEEAKRMMIEGTVEVQGTVKVDNSAYVEKYLTNARRAYEKQDWEETEKYYNLVEQNDPSNIEAIFYSAYAKACNTLIDADFFKKEAAFGVLTRCVGIIDDNYDPSEKEIVQRVGKDILGLYNTNFVFTQKKNGYGMVVQDDRAKTVDLFNRVGAEFVQSCLNIADTYPDGDENRLYFYKIASNVADISCKHDYAVKIKKMANPGSADIVKQVTFINDFNGVGSMTIYLTVSGVFEKRLIPRGTSTIEFMPGEYDMIMYCGFGNDPSTAVKKRSTRLSVPRHSRIEITWKFFENGYNFKLS